MHTEVRNRETDQTSLYYTAAGHPTREPERTCVGREKYTWNWRGGRKEYLNQVHTSMSTWGFCVLFGFLGLCVCMSLPNNSTKFTLTTLCASPCLFEGLAWHVDEHILSWFCLWNAKPSGLPLTCALLFLCAQRYIQQSDSAKTSFWKQTTEKPQLDAWSDRRHAKAHLSCKPGECLVVCSASQTNAPTRFSLKGYVHR